MNKKEISASACRRRDGLIIFVLAIISTLLLTLIILRDEAFFSPYPGVVIKRGLPIAWFVESPLKYINYIYLLFDFIFWFLIILVIWQVIQLVKKKKV
jgi:hypothetical protein